MFYQFKHFGISEYFCKEYGDNFSFPVHLHNSFEFITVFSGEMTVTVDNDVYTLKPGSSVLIFPNQLHSLQSLDSRHMLCIFSPELVRAYFSKVREKIPISNMMQSDDFLINILDNLLPDPPLIEKKGILYYLCAQFDKNAAYKNRIEFHDGLLQKIFAFIEKHHSGDCSLKKLSDGTGYSYCYLSRYFKKFTGISFNSYVNQYRVSKACYLLNNTSASVLQCALESGYDSLRSFNRNFFAALSETPSEYRKRSREVQP